VIAIVATHLETIRTWHNEHPASMVPEGINPVTGNPLNELDRQIIADSSMPKSVHENLMTGLRKDLTEDQVDAILDKYTVGKVAFTMKGYHAIVPDLTSEEEATILGYLKEAREMAVDYKSMKQISAIFEIYKTKSEQYLNSKGRSWKTLFKAYVDAVKAKKAEAAKDTNK
jgi:exonuclease V gamma subunit